MEDGSFINIMNQNAFINNDINDIPRGKNYDLILMEKDKEIINLSNANASLRNQIEQFQKILKEKDMEINSIKSDMSTLNSDQKLKEEENNILKNRINDLSSEIVQKKKEIEAISTKNNGNINNINKAFDIHMSEYQKLFKNYNDLSNELNALNDKYLKKEKECLLQQKTIRELRNENKKVLILNKDLLEKDKVINNLKRVIKNNNEEISNHEKENKYLNEQIQSYSSNEECLFKTRQNIHDYENIINDIKNNYNRKLRNKDMIINDYKNNTIRAQANNENLITYIIEQIQQVQKNFEKYNTNIDLDEDYPLSKYTKISENDSKFDLIHQNFVLLTQKLREFKRNNIFEFNKLKNRKKKAKSNYLII